MVTKLQLMVTVIDVQLWSTVPVKDAVNTGEHALQYCRQNATALCKQVMLRRLRSLLMHTNSPYIQKAFCRKDGLT